MDQQETELMIAMNARLEKQRKCIEKWTKQPRWNFKIILSIYSKVILCKITVSLEA